MKKLILLAILLSCLTACGELYRYAKSGEVGWALKKAIRDQHKKEVVLKELTHFSWDEFSCSAPMSRQAKFAGDLTLTRENAKTP